MINPFDTSALKTLFDAFPDTDQSLRFVGGCVRDALSNRPFSDIDLCTPYTPQEVIAFLTTASIKVIPTGVAHGTVMAIIEGQGYEITTLRHDIETDGRHAVVKFTTSYEEDAARRDFTFNALSRDRSGRIYDYHNGRKDLENGVTRFIGAPTKRIQEDYLRILRYFRFYARFSNASPDAETQHALLDNSQNLARISGERIQSEFKLLLKTRNILQTLSIMQECAIFKPSLNCEINLQSLKTYISYAQKIETPPCWRSRFLALIDLKPDALAAASKRLKLSMKDQKWMRCVLTMALKFDHEPLSIWLYDHGIEKTLCAYSLQCIQTSTEMNKDTITKIQSYNHQDFHLTGADLIKDGFKPGPDLGAELERRKRAWILGT